MPDGLSALVMPAPKKAKTAARSSAAVEDYLERILELINTKGYARVVDIAESLKISQASVTNMIQRLDAEGLLKYEKYRGMVLTTAGETLARNITRRHQLYEWTFCPHKHLFREPMLDRRTGSRAALASA